MSRYTLESLIWVGGILKVLQPNDCVVIISLWGQIPYYNTITTVILIYVLDLWFVLFIELQSLGTLREADYTFPYRKFTHPNQRKPLNQVLDGWPIKFNYCSLSTIIHTGHAMVLTVQYWNYGKVEVAKVINTVKLKQRKKCRVIKKKKTVANYLK